MPKTNPWNSQLYTAGVLITIRSGIALGRALLDLEPKNAPPLAKKSAKRLAGIVKTAEEALKTRQRESNLTDEQVNTILDQETDRSWTALRNRLSALADLPGKSPRPAKAGRMVTTLFGADGLTFLKLEYPSQFTVMDAILQRVADDKLGPQIDDLAGAEFLAQIRDAHERYRKMVKGILQQSEAVTGDLNAHVIAMRDGIADYAEKIVATVDPDEPATYDAVRKVLQPILNHREQTRRGGANASTPATTPQTTAEPANEPAPATSSESGAQAQAAPTAAKGPAKKAPTVAPKKSARTSKSHRR